MNPDPPRTTASRVQRRRWRRQWGLVFVGIALAQVFLGLTVWNRRLAGLAFVIYWLGCTLAASLALVVATLDALATAAEWRREQARLARAAAAEIERELWKRRLASPGPGQNGAGSKPHTPPRPDQTGPSGKR